MIKKSKKAANRKPRPPKAAGAVPKIYSIDTPYGSLTFLEGHGDDLDPEAVAEWENKAEKLREGRKRADVAKTAKGNGKKKK